MSVRHRLRVGYVGVSITPYFAEKYRIRETAVAALRGLSETLGFDLVAIERPIHSEAEAEAAAREIRAAGVDFLLIQNAACSMGAQLYPFVDAAPRLGLWSVPDPAQDGEVQLHSLVSMSHYASLLKSYFKDRTVPFKWFHGPPEADKFHVRFALTVRALTAAKNLARTRVGWIGGVSPGFVGMLPDEAGLRSRLGITVEPMDLPAIVARAEAMESGRVERAAAEIRGAATRVALADPASFERVTRFYLALLDTKEEMEFDAMAVQCWSTIQQLYNIAPCMAYSWLGSDHDFPVSCEGDVLGAVSMHMLNLVSGRKGSATLLDLASLDPGRQAMQMWHCGVTPRHFANEDGIAWVDHVTLGRNGSDGPYGVAGDQVFAPQPVTIAYVNEHGDRLLVIGSEIVDHPSKGYEGTRGWVSKLTMNGTPIDLWDLVNTLTVKGVQHHFAMGQGELTGELMELAAWTGMRLVEPIPYADHLQLDGVNC
jgi:L-fucose isomerase-like protein